MVSARRKAVESLYTGLCTIVEKHPTRDPIDRITRHTEVTVLVNEKCKLSYSKNVAAISTDAPTIKPQTIKLFLAPEIVVKAGSKIIVTQNGKTAEYSNSGESAVYMDHQEIMLDLFKGYT